VKNEEKKELKTKQRHQASRYYGQAKSVATAVWLS